MSSWFSVILDLGLWGSNSEYKITYHWIAVFIFSSGNISGNGQNGRDVPIIHWNLSWQFFDTDNWRSQIISHTNSFTQWKLRCFLVLKSLFPLLLILFFFFLHIGLLQSEPIAEVPSLFPSSSLFVFSLWFGSIQVQSHIWSVPTSMLHHPWGTPDCVKGVFDLFGAKTLPCIPCYW